MIKLRKARPSDHAAILKMDGVCFPGDERIEIGDDSWWVAVDPSGSHVGYAGAQAWQGTERGGVKTEALFIVRTGVIPSARGNGLQRRFIRAIVAHGKRLGVDEIWSYTAHSNTARMNGLIRSGFATWLPHTWGGWWRPWRPDGENGWVYWRRVIR